MSENLGDRERSLTTRLEAIALIILFTLLFLVIVVQVLFRVTRHTAAWTTESAKFLFVWLCFVGVASGTRLREHVGTSFLARIVGPKVWAVLEFVSLMAFAIFAAVMLISGVQVTLRQYTYKYLAAGVPIPMYLVTMVIPVAWGICLIYLFGQMWEKVRGRCRHER